MEQFLNRENQVRKWILLFVAACLHYSGIVKLALSWAQHFRRELIILNYHEATGGDLRRHILYLSRYYRILRLEDALEELYKSDKQEKQVYDRRLPLVLTFDDGYHDNYTVGFALARELQLPITIFLIPGYTESGHYFWWQEIQRLVQYTQVDKVTIEGRIYHLGKAEERDLLIKNMYRYLFYANSVAVREAFLADIRAALAVPSPALEEKLLRSLTWEEIRELDESGWVSFGAHTMNHPNLAQLTDPAEVQFEVTKCRIVLEEHLGHPVHTFAYPFGAPEDIGAQGLQAVRAGGYKWALTTIGAVNTSSVDPYLLHRFSIDVDMHWLVLALKVVKSLVMPYV